MSRVPFYHDLFQNKPFPFFPAILHKQFMHQLQDACRECFQIVRQIKNFLQVKVFPGKKRIRKSTVNLIIKKTK